MGYFLVKGFFPNWVLFPKPIHNRMTEAKSVFMKLLEARRKDIERFFGVLKSRFYILRRETSQWENWEVVRIKIMRPDAQLHHKDFPMEFI